jgi:hypothetical protein
MVSKAQADATAVALVGLRPMTSLELLQCEGAARESVTTRRVLPPAGSGFFSLAMTFAKEQSRLSNQAHEAWSSRVGQDILAIDPAQQALLEDLAQRMNPWAQLSEQFLSVLVTDIRALVATLLEALRRARFAVHGMQRSDVARPGFRRVAALSSAPGAPPTPCEDHTTEGLAAAS